MRPLENWKTTSENLQCTLKGVSMKELFNLAQRPDEQVTDYVCRLETALKQAFKGSAFPQGNRSDLLCERLWSGLRSASLRTNTRHKLDSADVRQVEKELSLSNPNVKVHSSSVAVSAPVTLSPPVDLFQKKMDYLKQPLNNRISSVQSGVDKKFSAIL